MTKRILSLEAINSRLAGTGVTVERRGNRLSIRATLPCRDGKPGNKQTRIALDTTADRFGLEYAEAKALEIAAQKAQHRFRWEDWDPTVKKREQQDVTYWVEKFKQDCETRGVLNDPTTWRRHYWPSFKFLPQDKPLTEEAILDSVRRTKDNTQTRLTTCLHLQSLARMAGVEINLNPYKGNYSSTRTAARDLPEDDVIPKIRDGIVQVLQQGRIHPQAYRWQWVYGVMAAYGLRNHETFFCEISSEPPYTCRVLEGKTGFREIEPFYVEWVEAWQLWDIKLPKAKIGSHWEVGHRVSTALGRYISRMPAEIQHDPYDLRHAYAIRGGVVFGMPIQIMAQYMGHTPEVHLRTYNKWLKKAQASRLYREKMAREDRPKPPGWGCS